MVMMSNAPPSTHAEPNSVIHPPPPSPSSEIGPLPLGPIEPRPAKMHRTEEPTATTAEDATNFPCLSCLGRHRSHTCGRGGKRGRPKGSMNRNRLHKEAGPAHAPPPAHMIHSAAQSPIHHGVHYRGAGEFTASVLSIYDTLLAAMVTNFPAPMQQPALVRLADALFCADAILRIGTGIWASLEFGPRAALPQTTVTLAEAEHRLQEICRAYVPGLVGARLFGVLRDSLPAARCLLVPDDAPNQLEGCRAALAGAALSACPSCGPYACQQSGAAGHASVPTPVAIHLRVVHHHRLAVHGALLRLAAHDAQQRAAAFAFQSAGFSSFDSTSSSPSSSSVDSLVEMSSSGSSSSDSNGSSSSDDDGGDDDDDDDDVEGDGPAAAQDRDCALLLSFMRGAGK